jgi:Phage integrase, N-terminal SAM-like domain
MAERFRRPIATSPAFRARSAAALHLLGRTRGGSPGPPYETSNPAEATLAQRKAEVAKQREAIANGEQVKDDITLSTLFERFLKQKEENTIRRYETLVKLYLKPRFGAMQAKHLKPRHLMTAYSEWLGHGRDGRTVAAKTNRRAHELLRKSLTGCSAGGAGLAQDE